MTKADDAYSAAERLIAAAAKSGATALSLFTPETRALTRLPAEIATLTALTRLDLSLTGITDLTPLAALTALTTLYLSHTQVTDLTPIATLTALTSLNLRGTRVTDLTPLAGLTALIALDLIETPVTDLTPVAALTALTALDLSGTQVTDLTPLAALTALTSLDLSGTQVTDLSPLAALTALTSLGLNRTPVTDLTPLAALTALTSLDLRRSDVLDLRPLLGLFGFLSATAEPPRSNAGQFGLRFNNTPATRADPRIAEIAAIPDPAARARTLFDYLQDWVPPGEVTEQNIETALLPQLPPRQPAPLETAILDNRLVVAIPLTPPLPPGPVDDRARKAWGILKEFRADFAKSLNIANYRPLATAIAAFDRAMADSYDHLNEIAVGLVGQRLAALAQDPAFAETLPEGAATELASLGAAITTFSNRFPEWLAYLNDLSQAAPVAAVVHDNIAAFAELEKSLAAADDVDPAVLDEYRDEVELARQSPQSETAARALLASTRDLLLTLSENVLMGLRLYRDGAKNRVVHEYAKFKDLIPNEIRKWVFRGAIAIAVYIFSNKGANVLALAGQFPTVLGWIANVLAALGVR